MQLSAIPSGASTFTISNTSVYLSSNESVYLNAFTDDRTYIMPASDSLKTEHWAGWGELLDPIVATLDHTDCSLNLTFRDNRYLQRYGFYVNLTPQPTGGQIQWTRAWAAEPPEETDDSFWVDAISESACLEEWYLEPCPAN